MYELTQAFIAVRDFMELGGNVLWIIAGLMVFMWIMILERVLYIRLVYKGEVANAINTWESRTERQSWNAHMIREALISRVRENLNTSLKLIQTCVALSPLLGLLGTVTGMIEVFEVMANSGTGNARSMASGVSKASIPTMAGMVAALSGVFMSTWLNTHSVRQTELLNDYLTMDH